MSDIRDFIPYLLVLFFGIILYEVNSQNAWQIPNHQQIAYNIQSTTPWPALGSKRNQYPFIEQNARQEPVWVRPATDRPKQYYQANSNKTVNLSDILKLPNYTPGTYHENKQPTTTNTDGELDNQLRTFSENLLSKDVNNAAKNVKINFQGKTTSRSQIDEAPLPLLSISPSVYNIPTISKLTPLYDNYVLETNVNEQVTRQEENEENAFLDAILSTPVFQITRNFLMEKGVIGKDYKELKDLLHQIWFKMYPRGGGRIGSSGFEHVFLAELKNRDVSGLHNWLYFSKKENEGVSNYLGYMKKLDLGDKGAIIKYHFQLANMDKPVGSMFIGTSPELEFALYTTCFLLKADKVCPLRLNGHNFIIRTYTYRYRGQNLIGSAFPEI